MAEPVTFPGVNFTFKGDGDAIGDLAVFRQPNGPANVSCWQLTADEIAEVNRTGCIYLTVMSGRMLFPNFVGGERETRAMIADTGQLWERDHA
ncbi:MAG: hypothetical protein KGJ57_17645 [Sphingomonadales bacterium]|nr:hypothetical protein [Sphingomonadales bacterium]MDE2171223.1 hypothetical protein [Sphingomonadales bacterium]